MLQLILFTGCLVAISHAFVSPTGIYTGAAGLTIDFNRFRGSPKALEGICNAAVMQNGGRATDALSDVMRSAVDFFTSSLGATGNPALLGSGSPQWTCLLQASTSNGMNPGNAANGVGDYYDTVVELPINQLLPFAFNPCSMVFCGEQGMTPMAIAMEVSRRLQFRQPLGSLANYFGSYASMLNQPQAFRPPMGGPAGGLAGMMQAMSGAGAAAPGGASPAGTQNPLAQMSSLLAKMQSAMGNPGSPNPIPNPAPLPAGGAAASPAAQQPPAPLPTPDAAAAGGSASSSGTGAPSSPNAVSSQSAGGGFMDMILKMQQMMKGGGGAAPASPAAAPNPFASMMGGMGGMPGLMGGMGGLSSMMGGLSGMMGGGLPSAMGGAGGMGGLMNMMAMNAAMQDAPDYVPGMSPFGGMGAMGGMGGMPFSGMTGLTGSSGTAGSSTGGLMG